MLNLRVDKLATWNRRVIGSFVVIWSVASLKYLLYLFMKEHLRDFIKGIYVGASLEACYKHPSHIPIVLGGHGQYLNSVPSITNSLFQCN
jgi:hypothetical protein